jgi:hypothetical protein
MRPQSRSQAQPHRHWRTLALGSIVLAFYIRAWALHGLPGIESAITSAFAVVGTALGGLLALSGDGDVVFFTGVNEGQRETIHRAGAAFSAVS